MSLGTKRAALLLQTVVAVAYCATAHAETVSISLSAPSPCGSQADLAAMVQRRTQRALVVESTAHPSRQFEVTVSQRGSGGNERGTIQFSAKIVVDGVASDPIEDPQCEEVMNATALIIALAIDPAANTAALVKPAVAPPIINRGRSRPVFGGEASKFTPPRVARAGPGMKVFKPHRFAGWWLETSGAFGLAWGPGPGAMPTFAASITVGSSRWALQADLIAGQTTNNFEGLQVSGAMRFRWLTSQTAVCNRMTWSAVTGQWCAGLQVGTLQTTAKQVINAQSRARLWLAPELQVQAGWRPSQRVPALSAILRGSLFTPLTRAIYIVQPAAIVHQTPTFAGSLDLGLQWKW